MGIDYGAKRVGIALSDESSTLAFPETTLACGERLADAVDALARAKDVGTVVLGESLDFKNRPNKIMEAIEGFKRELEERGFSVVFEPEHLTSAAASRLQEGSVDAAAAAIILQSYLDKLKNKRA